MVTLSRRKKVTYAALSIALALVALELAARGALWIRARRHGPKPAEAVINRFHPLRYELAPGTTLPANGPIARINNVGLRGADADVPKRRTRVLCAGDSCTFGYA